MNFSPDEIYAELVKSGNAWSDAEAQAQQLEEMKSVVLSELKLRFDGGDASREMQAKATPEYKTHIAGMVEARRIANRARVRWISAQALADARRTQAATARAELRNA